MKYLLEFANFSELVITKDVELNRRIDLPFRNDTRLISVIHLKDDNKDVFFTWYDTEIHPMIDRIKRTSIRSISEFNEFFTKVIEQLFNQHFKKMDDSGRYALYMKERNFYIMIDIDYENLFSTSYTILNVVSIRRSSPHNVYKVIEINDENF